MIHIDDIVGMYPTPEYSFIWRYENRIVVRKNAPKESGIVAEYYFYFWDRSTDLCRWLAAETNFEIGEKLAMEVWKPKKNLTVPVKFSEQEKLEHISQNLLSLVKRNKSNEIVPSDFCFVYYSGERWVCYIPESNKLLDFAKNNGHDMLVTFLDSDSCVTVMQAYLDSGFINMPFSIVTV